MQQQRRQRQPQWRRQRQQQEAHTLGSKSSKHSKVGLKLWKVHYPNVGFSGMGRLLLLHQQQRDGSCQRQHTVATITDSVGWAGRAWGGRRGRGGGGGGPLLGKPAVNRHSLLTFGRQACYQWQVRAGVGSVEACTVEHAHILPLPGSPGSPPPSAGLHAACAPVPPREATA